MPPVVESASFFGSDIHEGTVNFFVFQTVVTIFAGVKQLLR